MFERIPSAFAPWIFMDLLIILDIFDERGTHFVSAHESFTPDHFVTSLPRPLTISLRIILMGGCIVPTRKYTKRWHVFNEFSARWLPQTEHGKCVCHVNFAG